MLERKKKALRDKTYFNNQTNKLGYFPQGRIIIKLG